MQRGPPVVCRPLPMAWWQQGGDNGARLADSLASTIMAAWLARGAAALSAIPGN